MAKNHKKFVDAVRARGGVRYFDLGGGVNLDPTTVSGSVNPTQQSGGLGGLLSSQNGYSAQLAPTTQINYNPTIAGGINTANQNIGNEQALEQTLLAQSQGQGPNPAQAQLAQNTGTNVANQAALMANQRGGSTNAGLIARQAAQQGAQTQQNSVGQAASLQAQQQLAAQQGAAALQSQVGSQAANLYGTGVSGLNTQNANLISNYGQAQGVNAQATQNNTNSANTTLGGIFGGAAAITSLLAKGGEVKAPEVQQPALTSTNFAEGGPVSWAGQYLTSGMPSVQSSGSVAQVNVPTLAGPGEWGAKGSEKFAGQIKQVGTNIKKAINRPDDGTLTGVGTGGDVSGAAGDYAGADVGAGAAADAGADLGAGAAADAGAAAAGGAGLADLAVLAAKGGRVGSRKSVPAMVSPGEKILPPDKVNSPNPIKDAVPVPGKAKVKGDSLKNDTVPANLPEGAIVLPRHVTQHKNAPQKAAEFVRAVQAKQGMKRGKRK